MKDLELNNDNLGLGDIEVPRGIELAAHRCALKKALLAEGVKPEPSLVTGVKRRVEQASQVLRHSLSLPIWKPVLAIIVVLAMALTLVPVLTHPAAKTPVPAVKGSSPAASVSATSAIVSASDIALSDPQVRATFTPDQLTHLNVQVTDGDNGQKVVLLSCDTGMMAVGVDMATQRVSEWLLDTVGSPPSAAPSVKYQLILEVPNFENGVLRNGVISLINTDGSGLINLTDNSGLCRWPDWSVQSGKIVFASDKSSEGNNKYTTHLRQIYTINADGSDMKMLTWMYDAMMPKWSPDGTKIAFAGAPEYTSTLITPGKIDNDYEIYVMNADGSGMIRLTDNYNANRPLDDAHFGPAFSGANDDGPQWSPDGTKIAFWSDMGGDINHRQIWCINADGSNLKNLTNNSISNSGFSWSPDGKKIAFASGPNDVRSIFVMNSDGSGVTCLTGESAEETSPSWSPDGSKIAFCSNRDGKYDIYMSNPAGTNITRLTNLQNRLRIWPSWSPDGRQIAVLAPLDSSSWLVYMMNSDGGNLTKITDMAWSFVWASFATYPVSVVWQNGAVPDPSDWPVTQEKAIAIASSYLPPNVISQADIYVSYKKDSPTINVSFSQISVSKSDLDWDTRFDMKTAPYDSNHPGIFLFGDGPFVYISVSIDGKTGGVKTLVAIQKNGV